MGNSLYFIAIITTPKRVSLESLEQNHPWLLVDLNLDLPIPSPKPLSLHLLSSAINEKLYAYTVECPGIQYKWFKWQVIGLYM